MAIIIGLAITASVGSFWYRYHQLQRGISEYNQSNYIEAFRSLSPFSGWGNAEAELDLGKMYLYGRGVIEDVSKGIYLLESSASSGNSIAQYSLGNIYQDGKIISTNFARAAQLLRKSALQGHALAQNDLGKLYSNGEGVPQDYTEAAAWFQRAANQDNFVAEYNLGILYQNGNGFPRDDRKSHQLFKKAADKGYANAQYELGRQYAEGNGVSQDFKLAASWYQSAADQGHADAMHNLGGLYVKDEGVERNLVYAYALLNISASLGTIKARDNRDNVAKYLTPQQIISGQDLSSKWQPGLPLENTTQPEDLAPQLLLATTQGQNLPSRQTYHDAIKGTSVLFSKDFFYDGQEYYVVFLSTEFDGSHADGAYISAVTYRKSGGRIQRWPALQLQFTKIGSFGKKPDPVEMHKFYQFDIIDGHISRPAKQPTKTELSELTDKIVVLLIDDYWSGMGMTIIGKHIFRYDGRSWSDVGYIITGEENSSADCAEKAPPNCYAWSGKLELKSVGGSLWPDILMTLEGTEPDRSYEHILPVPGSRIFRFNGKNYNLN